MKISKIDIKNFKSIESLEVEPKDFNLLVGQNNSGKTNFFEALNWFYNGGGSTDDLKFKREAEREIEVAVTFSGAQHGSENMVNEANKTKMEGILKGSDTITFIRKSSDPKKRTYALNGIEGKNPAGFDAALNDFLPKFEYIHTRQYFEEFTKYSQKSAVGIMLSSVIEEILKDDPKYNAFRSTFEDLFNSDDSAVNKQFKALGTSVQGHLEKQFAECSKVYFEVLSPEFSDLLKKFETVVDDGIATYASEKGDGMQRALMLAVIQAYADFRKSREAAGKSFLFFIDEAELHLHPTAQRKLKNVLHELSKNLDQVFISTHSSVFVADSTEDQQVFKCEKNDSRTAITPTDEDDKPYIIYDLLGGSPSDLLLPKNFLIVEGQSELEFLTRVIKRHYAEKPTIHIVSAEGDTHQAKRSVNAIKKAFSPMGASIYRKSTIILCDKPSVNAQQGFTDFIKSHDDINKNGQIFILDFGSLEECYPNFEDWCRTKQAVDNMDGKQKINLAKRVGDNITSVQFEKEMGLVYECLQKTWVNSI